MNIFLLYLGVIPTVIFLPYRTISTRSYKQGYLLAVYCLVLCGVEAPFCGFCSGFPIFLQSRIQEAAHLAFYSP